MKKYFPRGELNSIKIQRVILHQLGWVIGSLEQKKFGKSDSFVNFTRCKKFAIIDH